MQPGRVILLLITKVSLMMVRGPSLWMPVDGHISEQIYDGISQWANRILLSEHTLPRDYYSTKKLVNNLGLPVDKIHACKNGCMLYWKDDINLEYCKFYGDGRDCIIRLGLCRDGFAPHDQYSRTYSCWPVIITPYLPSSMCMSSEYIFLTMVISGPFNPKHLIDVYLESLIEELLQLWHVGARTYDHATDRAFIMRTVLMWTVNDLPTYGMASGWSTSGVMGCPVYMNDTRAFHLQHVDEKSIFWDLPYWPTLFIYHNLDVMHIEKNIFDNIFNTMMDIKGKTKDNMNAWRDLKIICNRPKLELDERRPNIIPKAVYTLWKEQKMRVCEWIRALKFPDGYASNLARCVDMTELWMHDMKSHDCHYFKPDVQSKWSMPRINDECTSSNDGFQVSIFNYPGRASGAMKKRWLSGPERHIIKTYILTNCEVITPYYVCYLNELYQHHHPADPIIDRPVLTEFKDWFKRLTKEVVLVPIVAVDNQSYDLRDPNGVQVVLEATGTSWGQLHESDDENEDEDEDSDGDDETDDEEYEAT
ncbi:hypothetical protein Sango_1140600 [Sesamum angolense]|uniref:Uncharacterized protein n=1 Tax=Sesamum angolense TaxID=2727404 RepID=A0AAE1WVD6_9LAMI|nr:hypothetical protein Sango_1140600 [Sesamum angolense]